MLAQGWDSVVEAGSALRQKNAIFFVLLLLHSYNKFMRFLLININLSSKERVDQKWRFGFQSDLKKMLLTRQWKYLILFIGHRLVG